MLLVLSLPSVKVMKINRPAMATAFIEHLFCKVDALGYGRVEPEKVRIELRALIQELES